MRALEKTTGAPLRSVKDAAATLDAYESPAAPGRVVHWELVPPPPGPTSTM